MTIAALKETLDLAGNHTLGTIRIGKTNDDALRIRENEIDDGTIRLAAATNRLHIVARIHPPTIVEIASEKKTDTGNKRKGRPLRGGGDAKERIPKKDPHHQLTIRSN